MSDTQADGYYDEPELNSEELDLSFLDDDEDGLKDGVVDEKTKN